MITRIELPRLYAIIDFEAVCLDGQGKAQRRLSDFAEELVAGGVTLIQYRDKKSGPGKVLGRARDIRLAGKNSTALRWVLNDRADLSCAAGYDGVHLGVDDLAPAKAGKLLRGTDGEPLWIGVSTHNMDQVSAAEELAVDYIAVGPVFATGTKEKPDPVIGLAGVSSARKTTRKPLVAIGGITRANCRSVIDAGADSVAVIGDLVAEPRRAAEEFLRIVN